MNDNIDIILTKDEAWVLFDFVKRFSDSDKLSIEDQSEERVLWNLCCVLEKTLHQSGNEEYRDFIEGCKSRLRDEG